MKISVVIPTYNEKGYVGRAVERLLNEMDRDSISDVIVVDGGSGDGTIQEARSAGALVIEHGQRGRASQMNAGAAKGSGDVLYFMHADGLPPLGYAAQILEAIGKGASAGCMRMTFDRHHWVLRLKGWFTRFRATGLHYGDQSLFVQRELFNAIHGFKEEMTVFEDLDIIERIVKAGTFEILEGPVVTSARKYDKNGMIRMQLAFYVMYPLYRMGVNQKRLVTTYERMVRQDKL